MATSILNSAPAWARGGGNVFDDGVEERLHVGARMLDVGLGVAVLGAGIDDGKIQLLIGGVEGDEEIEHHGPAPCGAWRCRGRFC